MFSIPKDIAEALASATKLRRRSWWPPCRNTAVYENNVSLSTLFYCGYSLYLVWNIRTAVHLPQLYLYTPTRPTDTCTTTQTCPYPHLFQLLTSNNSCAATFILWGECWRYMDLFQWFVL